MTTGTIIVFLWAINFLGWAIERAIRNEYGEEITAAMILATIFTALEFGAIKLIDYEISIGNLELLN